MGIYLLLVEQLRLCARLGRGYRFNAHTHTYIIYLEREREIIIIITPYSYNACIIAMNSNPLVSHLRLRAYR